MTSRYQSLVAVGGLVTALCGGCPGFPEDQGGDGGLGSDLGQSGLTINLSRIPITGNVKISVQAGKAQAGKTVELRQSATSAAYPLGLLNGDGALDMKIPAGAFAAAFKLGIADVVVVASSPAKKATVRLYLDPTFNGLSPSKKDIGVVTTATDPTPVWIGITGKQILALSYRYYSTTRIDQVIGGFSYNTGDLTITPATPTRYVYSNPAFPTNAPMQDNYTSVGVALSEQAILLASYEVRESATPTNLLTCSLLAPNCDFGAVLLPLLPFKSVAALTADRTGSAFAAIVRDSKGSDSLRAFNDIALKDANSIPINSNGTSFGYDSLVSFGLLDSDDKADLIIWSNNKLSVLVNKSATGFVFDAKLSDAANKALSTSAFTGLSALTTGDVDGDGLDDIVAAEKDKLALLVNQSGANFAGSSIIAIAPDLAPVSSIAVGKVADGKAPNDLAIASKSNKRIGVLVNAATY